MTRTLQTIVFAALIAIGPGSLPRGSEAAGVAAGGFTTYLGGSGKEDELHIRADRAGNTYVVGRTQSRDFPGSRLGRGKLGNEDFFAAKYAPTGQLVYARLIGAKQEDSVREIAVDGSGSLHIAGITGSKKFPTSRAFQSKYRGQQDTFLMKLGPTGELVFSTFLGGGDSEEFWQLQVDDVGNAFVVGNTRSSDFPVTPGAYIQLHGNLADQQQVSGYDGFITKFAPDGQVVYSTFVGGWQEERISGVILVPGGDVIATGGTSSGNLRMVNAFQPYLRSSTDGFIVRLDANGAPVFSTYLGGSRTDAVYRKAIDPAGNLIVNGYTESSDFPMKNAMQTPVEAAGSFVAKLSPTGSLVYSTYIGGTSPASYGSNLMVDEAGSAFVVGGANYGEREHFPFIQAVDTVIEPGSEIFFTKLDSQGACLVSTLLGGRSSETPAFSGVDGDGNCYIAGETSSTDFPTRAAYQGSTGNSQNLFIARFDTLGALTFSTYLGGSGQEKFSAAEVGPDGFLYLVGVTGSDDLPVTSGSLPRGRFDDAMAARFDAHGVPVFVTYLGGQGTDGQYGLRMAIDADGATFIGGDTASPDFPVFNAPQPLFGGQVDGFVTVLASDGRIRFSTFVGGQSSEYYFDMSLGPDGAVTLVSLTGSPDVPTRHAAQPSLAGDADALVSRFGFP